MQITKLGHCALLIKERGLTLLTDPGSFTVEQQRQLTGIDVLLITHEHADHMHADSVKALVAQNPGMDIVTNAAVGGILAEAGIRYEVVAAGQCREFGEVLIEGFGSRHEEIYGEFGLVENTGYFVNNKLFYPGDAYTNPEKAVDILALPVAGPWLLLKDAVNYAKKIHPRCAFPVHDGMLKTGGVNHTLMQKFLEQDGIVFAPVDSGPVPFE